VRGLHVLRGRRNSASGERKARDAKSAQRDAPRFAGAVAATSGQGQIIATLVNAAKWAS